MERQKPTRLIVGITGATGTIFGVRLLQLLHGSGVETHLVLSNWGARTLVHETSYTVKQVQQLATKTYAIGEQGAAISSGSFVTMGMVVAEACACLFAVALSAYGAQKLLSGTPDYATPGENFTSTGLTPDARR